MGIEGDVVSCLYENAEEIISSKTWFSNSNLLDLQTVKFPFLGSPTFVPLVSTASQGTSNIPFPWFLMLGCNSQAQVFIFLSLAVGTIRTNGTRKRLFPPKPGSPILICWTYRLLNSLSLVLQHLPCYTLNVSSLLLFSFTICNSRTPFLSNISR